MAVAFGLACERAEAPRRVWGIPTGFGKVDEITCGFASGELAVLVAGPGEGKSSFALVATVNAAKVGARVLVFAPQLGSVEAGVRLLAADARVELDRLRGGKIETRDWEQLADSANRLSKLDVTVCGDQLRTLGRLEEAVREWRGDATYALVVVDGLELVAAGWSWTGKWPPDVSSAALGLKRMARELGVAVLVTCDSGTFGVPSLALSPMPREELLQRMGGVGMAADFVFWLDRYPDGLAVDAVAAKSRRGDLGRAKLCLLLAYARFMNRVDDPGCVGLRWARGFEEASFGQETRDFGPTAEEFLTWCFHTLRVDRNEKSTLGGAREYVAAKLVGNTGHLASSWDAEAVSNIMWTWRDPERVMGFDVSTVTFADRGAYRRLMEGLCERSDGYGCVVVAQEGRVVLLLNMAVRREELSHPVEAPVDTDFQPITSLVNHEDPGDLVLAYTAFQIWAERAGFAHDPNRHSQISQTLANLKRPSANS